MEACSSILAIGLAQIPPSALYYVVVDQVKLELEDQ